MPTDPAMLARNIGTLNDLDLLRDQPGALQEAVLAAESSDRDGGTPRPDLSGGSGMVTTDLRPLRSPNPRRRRSPP
jgi:hypothetical protein